VGGEGREVDKLVVYTLKMLTQIKRKKKERKKDYEGQRFLFKFWTYFK
jgi:hypothetical protein